MATRIELLTLKFSNFLCENCTGYCDLGAARGISLPKSSPHWRMPKISCHSLNQMDIDGLLSRARERLHPAEEERLFSYKVEDASAEKVVAATREEAGKINQRYFEELKAARHRTIEFSYPILNSKNRFKGRYEDVKIGLTMPVLLKDELAVPFQLTKNTSGIVRGWRYKGSSAGDCADNDLIYKREFDGKYTFALETATKYFILGEGASRDFLHKYTIF